MKTITKKILAGASAVALGAAMNAGNANAFVVGVGVPFLVAAKVQAEDTISVTITPNGGGGTGLAFGTFGTISDAGNTAWASMTTGGVFAVGTTGGTAKVIDGKLGDHYAAIIDIAAFQNSEMFASYNNVFDMKGPSGDVLQIVNIVDNMATTPGGCVITVNNNGAGADVCTNTTGVASTDNAGALTILLGGKIQTVAQAAAYHSENYTGSFDITLAY